VRTAEGWEVIAWVGPFSRRLTVRDSAIDDALVVAVGQLVSEPTFS
jgi:hypothetical protein